MRPRVGIAGLIAIVIVVGAWAGPVAADQGGLPDDIERAASALGMEASDVERYADGQEEFAEVASDIAGRWPELYVAATWAGPDSAETRIVVRPGGAEQVRARYDSVRVVEYDAMPESERDKLEWELTDELGQAQPERGASVSIDPLSGEAVVELSYPAGASHSQASRHADPSIRAVMDKLNAAGLLKVEVRAAATGSVIAESGSGDDWGFVGTRGFTARRGESCFTRVERSAPSVLPSTWGEP